MFIIEFLVSLVGKIIFPDNFFVTDIDLSLAEVLDYLGNASEI